MVTNGQFPCNWTITFLFLFLILEWSQFLLAKVSVPVFTNILILAWWQKSQFPLLVFVQPYFLYRRSSRLLSQSLSVEFLYLSCVKILVAYSGSCILQVLRCENFQLEYTWPCVSSSKVLLAILGCQRCCCRVAVWNWHLHVRWLSHFACSAVCSTLSQPPGLQIYSSNPDKYFIDTNATQDWAHKPNPHHFFIDRVTHQDISTLLHFFSDSNY